MASKIRNLKRKNIYNPTDLRVVLSGLSSGSANANITQTMTLTNLGLSWSKDTIVRVTLPAGLDFVSSPHGVHSGGVITWTLGTLKDAYTDTFVVISSDADDYEIVAEVETSTYDTDPSNSQSSHTLTIQDNPYVVEIRSSNIFFPGVGGPGEVTAFVGAVSGDLMPIFVQDIALIAGNIYRLGYLTEAIPAQGIDTLSGKYATPYDSSTFFKVFTAPYNGTDPDYTINTDGEPF